MELRRVGEGEVAASEVTPLDCGELVVDVDILTISSSRFFASIKESVAMNDNREVN
jgi:hypothetical protein